MAEFLVSLASNPYFSAGFGLVGVGTGLAVLRSALRGSAVLARRRFLVSLEIPNKDKSHHWVLNWISAQRSSRSQHLSVQTIYRQLSNGSAKTDFEFFPSLGTHWFKYQGRLILVNRQREASLVDLQSGSPWETVTLTAFGSDHSIFTRLLQDSCVMAMQKEHGKTVVFTAWGTEWRPFGLPRRRRPLESVILDDGMAEKVHADIKDFLSSSDWYIKRGIPYRRGYLFYGPPGCGKTSFIQALAGDLQYDICVLNLSERGMTDDKLNHLLAVAPRNSFILLEDVDAVFTQRSPTTSRDGFSTSITFSGLLNALDGVASTEERIIFLTTNHKERLDPALIRAGRIDVQGYIGYSSLSQLRRMFLRFHPDRPELADQFAQIVSGSHPKTPTKAEDSREAALATHSPTMAQLQAFFLVHKDDPEKAVADAHELVYVQSAP